MAQITKSISNYIGCFDDESILDVFERIIKSKNTKQKILLFMEITIYF